MNSVFSATVEKIETRADQTLKVSLGTQELSEQDEQDLFSLRKSGLVKVLISSEQITEQQKEAVSIVELEAPKGKSPSQRLRAVLYRYWNNSERMNKPPMVDLPFDNWYASEIERIINHYKTKLDEE